MISNRIRARNEAVMEALSALSYKPKPFFFISSIKISLKIYAEKPRAMHESIPPVYSVPVERDPARYHNSYCQLQWMPLKPFTCKIIIYYASIFSPLGILKASHPVEAY